MLVSINGGQRVHPGAMRMVGYTPAKMSLPGKGVELSGVIKKACVKRMPSHSQQRSLEKLLVRGLPDIPFTVTGVLRGDQDLKTGQKNWLQIQRKTNFLSLYGNGHSRLPYGHDSSRRGSHLGMHWASSVLLLDHQ